MKRLFSACLACLCLLVLSAYLLVVPVSADFADGTATCANGSKLSCSGNNCQSGDTVIEGGKVTQDGYCNCTSNNGTSDQQSCHDAGGGFGLLQ
ncbi:MAG: hypothetical protein M3348_13015 [Acidobacteriota bacterium]|nr:hypothetical protein [Acidobacteriota bacterium]